MMPASEPPSNCNVTDSPDAIATVPSCATITPSLRTSGASSAMYPPNAARRSPSLTTLPVLSFRENFIRPAMKSSLLMPLVLATSPPTSTLEPLPK